MKLRNRTVCGLAVLLLGASLGGCDDEGTDVVNVYGQVEGRITDADGDAVADATVLVEAFHTLPSGPALITSQSAVTDVDGEYAITLSAPLTPPETADAVVTVTPPAGSGLAGTIVEDADVVLAYPLPPTDTTVVNATLDVPPP